MKQISFLACLLCLLWACGKTPKGNPALVKQAQKVAELGCACADVPCLYAIRVEGKSVARILMQSELKELTEKEKKEFYAASRKYMDCEHTLNEKTRTKSRN